MSVMAILTHYGVNLARDANICKKKKKKTEIELKSHENNVSIGA